MDESSSESDSDTDDDDYETIYLECLAFVPQPFHHVVSDVSKSTSARVESTAKITSGFADRRETETENVRVAKSVEEGRFRNVEQSNRDPVVVIWRSYNNSDQEELEPEVQQETDHVTSSVSLTLPCLEEVCYPLCSYFSPVSVFNDYACENNNQILSRVVMKYSAKQSI